MIFKKFTAQQYEDGAAVPLCLLDEVYFQMSVDGIDPDYMCDYEADYVYRVLEDGPWQIQAKENVA